MRAPRVCVSNVCVCDEWPAHPRVVDVVQARDYSDGGERVHALSGGDKEGEGGTTRSSP